MLEWNYSPLLTLTRFANAANKHADGFSWIRAGMVRDAGVTCVFAATALKRNGIIRERASRRWLVLEADSKLPQMMVKRPTRRIGLTQRCDALDTSVVLDLRIRQNAVGLLHHRRGATHHRFREHVHPDGNG
jgi:hypothetical protein